MGLALSQRLGARLLRGHGSLAWLKRNSRLKFTGTRRVACTGVHLRNPNFILPEEDQRLGRAAPVVRVSRVLCERPTREGGSVHGDRTAFPHRCWFPVLLQCISLLLVSIRSLTMLNTISAIRRSFSPPLLSTSTSRLAMTR